VGGGLSVGNREHLKKGWQERIVFSIKALINKPGLFIYFFLGYALRFFFFIL